jgi:broad specificity phosphatase PhoE
MRHGEVGYIVNGQPVPPDQAILTDEGRIQCQAAAQVLADAPFDRVLATNLLRTQQTAQIVLGSRNLPLEIYEGLREIRSGSLLHYPPEQRRSLFVGSLTHHLAPDTPFLGGETFATFRARVLPTFQALLAEPNWRTLLIVGHSVTNRVILGEILGAGLENAAHMEQDAGCINIIDLDNRGYGIVRLLNFTPYNPAKLGMAWTTMERYFLELPEAQAAQQSERR